MRLIAFLFLAAFALAGFMRQTKGAASVVAERPVFRADSAPRAAAGVAPSASLAEPHPAPQVLRHKRRFAKAALRAIRKADAPQQARPQRPMAQKQMAKLTKPNRR
jgi:hypothetical protein